MTVHYSFESELTKLKFIISGLATRFPEQHREDLVQEGILGLYFAVETFDEQRNVPFEAYAVLCAKRRMYSYCTRFIKNDPSLINDIDSVESLDEFEDDVIDKAFTEELFEKLKLNLSDLENGVLELYLKDFSYASIAENMDVSEKSIDNAMSRIKLKLKKLMKSQN